MGPWDIVHSWLEPTTLIKILGTLEVLGMHSGKVSQLQLTHFTSRLSLKSFTHIAHFHVQAVEHIHSVKHDTFSLFFSQVIWNWPGKLLLSAFLNFYDRSFHGMTAYFWLDFGLHGFWGLITNNLFDWRNLLTSFCHRPAEIFESFLASYPTD